MTIGIYIQGDARIFYGNTLHLEPLGGIQTRIIILARELAKYHTVYVFAPSLGITIYDNVTYVNAGMIEDYIESLDCIIGYSHECTILDHRLSDVPLKIFFKRHREPFIGPPNILRLFEVADYVVTLGQWAHDAYWAEALSMSSDILQYSDKMIIIPGCIDTTTCRNYDRASRHNHMVYISVPNRGLSLMKYIYPMVRARVTDAELHIYGSFRIYGENWTPSDAEFMNNNDWLTSTNGVVLHDSIPYYDLIEVLNRSMVLGYPSNGPETSCSAMQLSMACGLPVVSTYESGLVDTYPGNPYGISPDVARYGSDEYINIFVDNTVELLTNTDMWYSANELSMSANYDVTVLVDRWLNILEGN